MLLQNTAFDVRWHTSLRRTAILTCLTLYNEDGLELLRSLVGLAENIEYLTNQNKHLQASMFPVCIIVDGYSTISPTVLKYLKRLNLISHKASHQGNWEDISLQKNGMTIFEAELSSTEIFTLATEVATKMHLSATEFLRREVSHSGKKVFQYARSGQGVTFPLLFCVKAENAGKLDSHWWFFRRICSAVQPDYCIQMDVGTVPNRDAIEKLWSVMESDPNYAAAAPSILVPPPSRPWHLLHGWQYADFVWDRVLHYPVQALSGYLEALSGQLCIFRYQSLLPAVGQTTGSYTSPLDRYFRGLQALPPFEANMFLAEDRVLGFELITQQNTDAKIGYVPDAIAITDRCQSLEELMRQRRRWINSGSIARLWVLAQLGRYWRNSNSPPTTKIIILLSMFWNALQLPMLWFLPAFTLGIPINLAIDSAEIFAHHPEWSSLTQGGVIAFLLLWLGQFWVSYGFHHHVSWQKQLLHLSLLMQFIIMVMLIVIVLLFGQAPTIIKVAASFCGVSLALGFALITVGTFSFSILKQMFSVAGLEILFSPIMNSFLSMYAITNLHDCSWGTKGLHNHDIQISQNQKKIALDWIQLERVIVLIFLALLILIFIWPTNELIKNLSIGLCSALAMKIAFSIIQSPFENSRSREFLRFRGNIVTLWLLTNGVLLFNITLIKGTLTAYLPLGSFLIFMLRLVMGSALGSYYILKTRNSLNEVVRTNLER